MALRDLDIKAEYRTKLADIAKAFLVPTLSESVSYKSGPVVFLIVFVV